MRTSWLSCIGFLFVFLLSSVVCSANAQDLKFTARVKVIVSGDENIKGVITSYLNRELRSLNDVELVDSDPEWTIMVMAMEARTIGGYKSGIILSTNIIRHFSNQILSSLFQEKFKEAGLKITSNLYWDVDQWLNVGPADKLQELCKKAIANFDTKHLEEGRKFFRKMKEDLKDRK